jgi:phosphatidylglycerophosphatase A
MRRLIVLLATWWGVGFCPLAPGTVGTLAAIPLFLVLSLLPFWLYLSCLLGLALLACWAAGRAEAIFGEQDPHAIVIDEVVGFLAVMIALPPTWPTWLSVLAGFILFRAFDVIKPPPIRFLERTVKGGYGVVLDDVLAALYAHIALRILFLFFPSTV